jgi:hypothetical protein
LLVGELAQAARTSGEQRGREDWTLAAVAWPDRDYYADGFGPEPALYEDGTCAGCGIDVTSTAKLATCPACEGICNLT